MRPIITIILLVCIAAIVGYRLYPRQELHPREDIFVSSVVELMLLSARSDSASPNYAVERDSILSGFDLTDSSLLALKQELNRDPDRLIEIWDQVEQRLKARRDSLKLPSGVDTTKE
jgi:hypothetical protein